MKQRLLDCIYGAIFAILCMFSIAATPTSRQVEAFLKYMFIDVQEGGLGGVRQGRMDHSEGFGGSGTVEYDSFRAGQIEFRPVDSVEDIKPASGCIGIGTLSFGNDPMSRHDALLAVVAESTPDPTTANTTWPRGIENPPCHFLVDRRTETTVYRRISTSWAYGT